MVRFGYICKKCGKSIRRKEMAHLIHVREGKILGECEGHYNGHGGVDEDLLFYPLEGWYPHEEKDNTNINSQDEIYKSCFELPTSREIIEGKRLFESKKVTFEQFIAILKESYSIKESDDDYYEKTIGVWKTLPQSVIHPTSGIVAYHAKCYHILERKNQVSLSPSESDPDQSCGRPRKEFCCKRDLVMVNNKKE